MYAIYTDRILVVARTVTEALQQAVTDCDLSGHLVNPHPDQYRDGILDMRDSGYSSAEAGHGPAKLRRCSRGLADLYAAGGECRFVVTDRGSLDIHPDDAESVQQWRRVSGARFLITAPFSIEGRHVRGPGAIENNLRHLVPVNRVALIDGAGETLTQTMIERLDGPDGIAINEWIALARNRFPAFANARVQYNDEALTQ